MELILDNNIDNKLEKQQNKFINTCLGKVINTGMNIGIRAVMPDLLENEVINIKDAILENGFKSRIKYSNIFCDKYWKKCNRYFEW